MGYAIPIDEAMEILQSLMEGGEGKRTGAGLSWHYGAGALRGSKVFIRNSGRDFRITD